METTLVIRNDGVNFEQMYYQAICLGELKEAERLYAEFSAARTPHFWRDAFQARGLQETVLMSAIVNMLDMPFGSYVFTRLDDEEMHITPWLYGDAEGKRALVSAIEAETADAPALNAYARTLHLTADFLEWLPKYNRRGRSEAEATHE